MSVDRRASVDLEGLLEQHRQIERLIEDLDHAIINQTTDCCKIAERAKWLCHLLESHFRYEEEGGYFSETVLVAPRLVERAKNLERQHTTLLELLHAFCNKTCADGVDRDVWWATAKESFSRFKEEIFRHEKEENQLLQEAFLADLGAKD